MLGSTSNSVLSDRVFDLIHELNTIQPTILYSVLPQLEFKLKVCLLSFQSHVKKIFSFQFLSIPKNLHP